MGLIHKRCSYRGSSIVSWYFEPKPRYGVLVPGYAILRIMLCDFPYRFGPTSPLASSNGLTELVTQLIDVNTTGWPVEYAAMVQHLNRNVRQAVAHPEDYLNIYLTKFGLNKKGKKLWEGDLKRAEERRLEVAAQIE